MDFFSFFFHLSYLCYFDIEYSSLQSEVEYNDINKYGGTLLKYSTFTCVCNNMCKIPMICLNKEITDMLCCKNQNWNLTFAPDTSLAPLGMGTKVVDVSF